MRNKSHFVFLLLILCLLSLRLWHIRADFPDYHFYAQDRARFTDEGFYTGAALNHFLLGHAYIPGGWNPGVFMPVWPLMVGLLFHFSGISVTAARSLAVVCTWIGVLLAYAVARQYKSRTFASWTAFLVAVNALGFFFSRLAILEPAFDMFLLLAIFLAGRVRAGNYVRAGMVGAVIVLAILTKTTGVFVLPAVLYPIWARNRADDSGGAWKLLTVAVVVALVPLGAAKLIWSTRYAADAGIILATNPLWQIVHAPPRLLRFFFRGTWVDPVMFPLMLAAGAAAFWKLRFFWKDTLFVTAFLWIAGYAAFIVYHYDGPPRYFVTLIVPTIWLALIFLEWMWQKNRRLAVAVSVCVAASVLWNLSMIGAYLVSPRYGLVDASLAIKQIISAHDTGTADDELLIGRGAQEISLLSGGIAAIDSDGAMPLSQKLNTYHPGWFMDWTTQPMTRRETVAAHRVIVRQAVFKNLNRFNNGGIELYRILPRKFQ